MTDQEFEAQFAQATLPSSLFDHKAHLRLAWIHCHKYGVESAVVSVSQQIRRYTQSLGAKDKFNATLTEAAIRAVDHFMRKSTAISFSGFLEEFPRLRSHFKDLIAAHYSFDIYIDPQAKRQFLAPDLLPFDKQNIQ